MIQSIRAQARRTSTNESGPAWSHLPPPGFRWSGADPVWRCGALSYGATLRVEGRREAASEPLQLIRCLSEVSQSLLSRRTARDPPVDSGQEHAGHRLLSVLHSQVSGLEDQCSRQM